MERKINAVSQIFFSFLQGQSEEMQGYLRKKKMSE